MAFPSIVIMLCSILITDDEFILDQSSLDSVAEEAWLALLQECGLTDMEKPKTTLVDRETLEDVLANNQIPQLIAQGFSQDQATQKARLSSRLMGKSILALYDLEEQRIVVNRKNLEFNADLLDSPALKTREVLRAILTHEFVHAADDHRFGFAKHLKTLGDADSIQAYSAIIEGHAQYQARRICEKQGWSDAFETFSKGIGKVPPMEDAGLKLLADAESALVSAAYHDGEAFVASVLDRATDDDRYAWETRLYSAPPDSMELIYEPEWYIHPESRPELAFDIDGALNQVKSELEEIWECHIVSITNAHLRVSMELLPKEDSESVSDRLVRARGLSANFKEAPGSRQLAFVFYEFKDTEGALYFATAMDRLLHLKDEALKEGTVRIASADYSPIEDEDGWRGTVVEKVVKVGLQSVDVTTAITARGRVALEILFSNQPVDQETLRRYRTNLYENALIRGKDQGEDKVPEIPIKQ